MLRRALTAIALVTVCLAAGLISARESGAIGFPKVYTVDTTSDANLTACDQFTPGDCSLRGAINDANAHPNSTVFGADSIFFSISSGGVQTITPTSPLPPITDAVDIDATGQAAGVDNCGVGIMPCIRLDGTNAGTGAVGLKVSASGVSLRGLAIIRFSNAVDVVSGSNITIAGNYIGTADGISATANQYGIYVGALSSNVTIGGKTAADRNLISANSAAGMQIDGSSNSVLGNYIGTNAAGTAEVGDQGWGVYVSGSSNTIGGANAGEGNVISGDNLPDNAEIAVIDGHDNNIYGNLVGTNAAGDAAIPHFHEGILLSGQAHNNHIGGLVAGERNVISGNGDSGIILVDSTDTNEISDNYIGLNLAGDAAIPNSNGGIRFLAGSNTELLQSNTISSNVISGNSGPGMSFEPENGGVVRANTIEGNIIGLNAAGTAKIPNTGDGIRISSATSATDHDNVVRGNVISGNKGMGIHITGAETAHNTIRDNLIGTDAGGTQPLGNTTPGIGIDGGAPSALIVGNTIGANYIGVDITQTTTSDIELFTNYVGTNAGLDAGLGNKDVGIHIGAASGITIGGLTAPAAAVEANGPGGAAPGGNVIRNNTYDAIILEGANAVHDRISGNSIDDNGGAGISNQGSNNEQGAPVITSAHNGNGVTHIVGTLTSTPNQTFAVEVFLSPACDPSGFGEGRIFEAGAAVNTDGAGLGTIDIGFGPPVAAGSVITATATDSAGDTSDFSNCATVVGATPSPSPTPSPTHSPTATPHATPTPTATPSGLKGDANCDGKVDTTDALDTLSQTGGVPPGAACAGRADVNCNGQVDANDALRILLYAAGTPMTQPSGCDAIGA